MKLVPPGKSILLHVCCAPCSGAIIEALCSQGFQPTVFWSNSNILSSAENSRRLAVLEPYAASFGVPVVVDPYDHTDWLAFVRGQLSDGSHLSATNLASYPERGARCEMCFRYRLLRAARYALARGFDCLTTSLASSRWKSLEQVDAAGTWAVALANAEAAGSESGAARPFAEVFCEGQERGGSGAKGTGRLAPASELQWWPQNWRKGGLQPRRAEIIREQNFYNQTFCGCEFSAATPSKSTNNQSI